MSSENIGINFDHFLKICILIIIIQCSSLSTILYKINGSDDGMGWAIEGFYSWVTRALYGV